MNFDEAGRPIQVADFDFNVFDERDEDESPQAAPSVPANEMVRDLLAWCFGVGSSTACLTRCAALAARNDVIPIPEAARLSNVSIRAMQARVQQIVEIENGQRDPGKFRKIQKSKAARRPKERKRRKRAHSP